MVRPKVKLCADKIGGGKQRAGAKNPLICLTLRLEQLKPEHGGFDEGAHARGETRHSCAHRSPAPDAFFR